MESKAQNATITLENGEELNYIYFFSDSKCNDYQKEKNLVDLYCRFKEGQITDRIENPNNDNLVKREAEKIMRVFIKETNYLPL